MDKSTFLKKYNISEEDFNKTNLEWDSLMEIYNDFQSRIQELEVIANFVGKLLKKVDAVHSVNHRVKDPEHLIEKIIRKKLSKPNMTITLKNYTKKVTDLIGIRVLHLFKEDWKNIHEYIINTWPTVEKPKANIRKGDSGNLIDSFKAKGCKIVEHPFGYRSVHYIVKVNHNRKTFVSEIQVRTIFEEGWSEIDHKIRYPYDIDNTILANFLVIFNRLAGSADEMGSYVNYLHNELNNINENHCKELEEKNKIIDELRSTIDKLEIESEDKEKLKNKIACLEKKFPKLSIYHDDRITEAFQSYKNRNKVIQKSETINTDSMRNLNHRLNSRVKKN